MNLTKNSYEKYTCENLAILVDLIKEKTELNLEQVVFYAEKIPLKYIKINRINSNNGSKDKFFYINENLEESLYYFDYTFPFIEYVIHRIIFDIGNAPNINFSKLSPSAIGSFLENQILRNFADKKRIEKFLIRNVWSFQNIYPKEEKNIEKIDIFNFNIVICDDVKENPLLFFDSNYYIVPQNPINQYLDSVILIPCLSSAQVPHFDLISLQMTIKKNTIKFELIFKMSRDGTSCKDFHNLCDNKGPTLILIQTTKNRIFGGFTPLNWRGEKSKEREKSKEHYVLISV